MAATRTLLALLVLGVATEAVGCGCSPMPVDDGFAKSELVFGGKIERATVVGNTVEIVVVDLVPFKGEVGERITLTSNAGSGLCG